jgi:hypothetical protein
MIICINIHTMKPDTKSKRGGARPGAGRPDTGKGRYTVSLTTATAEAAKKRTENFSALLDGLLAKWLAS